MVTSADVEFERKLKQEYSKDGFLEILMGIALSFSSIMVGNGVFPGTFGLFPVLTIILKRVWRRKITYPRLGYAEIMDDRRLQIRRRLPILAVALVVTGLIMIVLVHLRHHHIGWPSHRSYAGLTLGVAVVLVLFALAAFERNWQLLYSVVPVIAILSVAYWQKWPLETALLISALIAFSVGIYRLITFLRRNPRPDREDTREITPGN